MNDPYRVICYIDGDFAVEQLIGGKYVTLELCGKGEQGHRKATQKRNELFTKIKYNNEQSRLN